METDLPSKPERPLDSDCCGQGCVPCVLDIYAQEVCIWEEECRRIKSGEKKACSRESASKETFQGPILSLTEYHSFTIESIVAETRDTYRYRFTLPAGAALGLKTGEHIVVRGDVDGECFTRQYTPVSDVNVKSYFELLIKIYDDGKMSQVIRSWHVGTHVQVRGPYGHLGYKQNKYRRVFMLAVGTGIAPMSQVIQTILNNEEDETFIQLLYGCRTYQDILLKSEMDEWSRYWNFSCTYFLSQEKSDKTDVNYKYGEKIRHERIGEDVLKSTISEPEGDILVLICGTRSFEKDVIEIIKDMGVFQDKYHKF